MFVASLFLLVQKTIIQVVGKKHCQCINVASACV